MPSVEQLAPLMGPLALSAIALLVFALFLLIGISSYRKGKAAKSWPATNGTITDSSIKEKRRKGKTRYKPRVIYSYHVVGKAFEARTISYGGRKSIYSRQEAEEYLRPYQKGAVVQVFYNPQNPSEACLIPGEGVSLIFAAIGGAGIVFILGYLANVLRDFI